MAFYLGLFLVKSYLQGANYIAYRRANCLTYSAFADFAPTVAHANFSQTISD